MKMKMEIKKNPKLKKASFIFALVVVVDLLGHISPSVCMMKDIMWWLLIGSVANILRKRNSVQNFCCWI